MGGFEPVRRKGAKFVQVHGWSDSLVSALAASSGLYETVLDTMGVERTKSFWKLYMAPGAGHCGGGIGLYPMSGFQAMVDWVENGTEPGLRSLERGSQVPTPRGLPLAPGQFAHILRWPVTPAPSMDPANRPAT
jgi:hypothetical protein